MMTRASLSAVLILVLGSASVACVAPPGGETSQLAGKARSSKGAAADELDEDADEDADDTSTARGEARAAGRPSGTAVTASCVPSEKVTTRPCATRDLLGQIVVKTQHVCSGAAGDTGKDVTTEDDQCRYSCTPRSWVDNLACGPRDVEERQFKYMEHVCDGSNRGAGRDVELRTDISGCQGHSPLVLDLDGDGLEVRDASASIALFDLRNDGVPIPTPWVGPREAFLTLDRNHDGIVNDRLELFGNMRGAANGFRDLAAEDANDDGMIDARDPIYGELRLWVDANGDGFSQPNELFTLPDLGVAAIDLGSEALPKGTTLNGQRISDRSTFVTTDGKRRAIFDIWFFPTR